MPSDLKDTIRSRVRSYLGKVPTAELSDETPAALVIAPVEAGISQFIEVDKLPTLDDLPFIPERMRDFAFRYATEYKPWKFWAKEYGVSIKTIEKWLRHEGVRGYIAISRYEQRMFHLAQHIAMQRQVYRTINDILRTKITADTIDPIGKMARFIYQALHNPEELPDRAKGTLNVNIGFPGMENSGNGESPYKKERNVTPRDLEKLDNDFEELKVLAKGIGIDLEQRVEDE